MNRPSPLDQPSIRIRQGLLIERGNAGHTVQRETFSAVFVSGQKPYAVLLWRKPVSPPFSIIWVKQLPNGEPLRITRHEADDAEPAFSPDGTQIAFHSNRDGVEIHVTPALGGVERLIAKPGWGPRYSPDGKWIAYQVGSGPVPPKIHILVVVVARNTGH